MTENKTIIPQEYIIKLQGKDFITHKGLLAIAHDKGLQSIETDLITLPTADIIVFKATAIIGTGVHEKKFTGYGDASDTNVNLMVKPHKLRMAETRAINRALRLATNVGMCSSEELGGTSEADNPQTGTTSSGVPTGDSHVPAKTQEPKEKIEEPKKSEKKEIQKSCSVCGTHISSKMYYESLQDNGSSLCSVCERKKKGITALFCTVCSKKITQKVHDFSISKYKKSLCFNCQKAEYERYKTSNVEKKEVIEEEVVM